ncbi:hypothetical protein DCE94_12710 [Agromyces badenianii]|nr:hypothetical protein DCE94_12710 [Agromyces badenianii]
MSSSSQPIANGTGGSAASVGSALADGVPLADGGAAVALGSGVSPVHPLSSITDAAATSAMTVGRVRDDWSERGM